MNGDQLSAALRAQAAGLASHPGPAPGESPGPGLAGAGPRLPAWAVLVLAVLLGAMAGGLAGIISTW